MLEISSPIYDQIIVNELIEYITIQLHGQNGSTRKQLIKIWQ